MDRLHGIVVFLRVVEHGTLPLKPQQRVALIGPVAGADGLLGA